MQKFLFLNKPSMKHGNLPRSPVLCKSFIMAYFHVLPYAFYRSKNIATACCCCTKASRTNDSYRTRWSFVLRCLRKPLWAGV